MSLYYLEAVTVCVRYADFLTVAAQHNRPIFDRWLIVTTPDDRETREVCRRFNLDVLLTEDATREGGFSKGRMIERGLQHLRSDGWRLHIDADMVLPANTRHLLRAAHIDPACLYGVDRLMVKSWADWCRVRDSGYLADQHDYHCRVRPFPGLELGTRWAHPQEGWCPLGAFQLWHSTQDEWRGIRVKPYPRDHGNACRTDIQHSLQWDRRQRVLLPELIAVHLESEPCPKGANWNGRTTQRFGPAPPLAAPKGY